MYTKPNFWKAATGVIAVLVLVSFSTGCNSLASLGLPFSSPNNRLLNSAKCISDLPGVALELPRELAEQPLDQYLVEIGDVLLVEPVSFDATVRLPGDQVVKPDGTISLGEFGPYFAVSKTVVQIQQEIQGMIDAELAWRRKREAEPDPEDRLENPDATRAVTELDDARRAEELRNEQQANRISVRLINWDSKQIYVLGEVNSPGSFQYTGNQTVLDALVLAGGTTGRANKHRIIVARPTPNDSCRIVLRACYDQIVQLGDTSTNYQLLPGDRVFVPSLTFWEDVERSLNPSAREKCPDCAPQSQACFGAPCAVTVQ